MDDMLKIAVGVFIGALAAAFTWEGIQTVRIEIALKRASDEMKRVTMQAEATNKANQARRQAAQEEETRAQQERGQRNAEAQQLQRLRQQDKEAAFNRFFQPTENCKKDAVQAACANAFMRANTVFNSQYEPTR